MCRFIPILFTIFLFSIACGAFHRRELKPYDQEKAGATIVESFDITEQAMISTSIGHYDDVYFTYDIAEFNNAIYIQSNGVIYVFDKHTFNKIGEIKLTNLSPINSPYFRGLAITAEGHAFLLFREGLYSIDLATGDAALLDPPKIASDRMEILWNSKVGYDTARGLIWFTGMHNNNRDYFFFTYDAENSFVFFEQKNASERVLWSENYPIGSIYANIGLFNGCTASNDLIGKGYIKDVGIVIRNLDNPSEILHIINVEYLNTKIMPRSAHYDGEFIWLLVGGGGRILMLKLLPHW